MPTQEQTPQGNTDWAGRIISNPDNVQPVEDTEASAPVEKLTSGSYNTDNYRLPRLSPAPFGMTQAGNIELNRRPTVQNADGSHSSEYSTSFQDEQGNEVLIPTVIDGKFFTPDGKKPAVGSPAEKKMIQAAIAYHRSTGQHLGVFSGENAVAAANAYAEALHNTPRDPKGKDMYVAPVIQQIGRSQLGAHTGHDIVRFDTDNGTHHIAIPQALPSSLRDSIASDVHKILSQMTQGK